MSSPLHVKISDKDNVAIAVNDTPAGALIMDGAHARQDVPQAHKIALCDILGGSKIIRYGVVLEYAINPIGRGQWTNEKMLELPTPPSMGEMKFTTNLVTGLSGPPVDTQERYINLNGGYTGTHSILGISTTVQHVAGVLNVAVARMKSELLPKYPDIDDIVPINRAYGCGVAIDAPETKVPIRALRNLVKHPNSGGELMAVGLGCGEFIVEMLLNQADISPGNVIILRGKRDFDDIVSSLMEVANRKLDRLNRRRRQTLPLSEPLIDMQCGGGDAFSGVAANPSADYAVDMLVKDGATVLFSEVTEVRNGVCLLGERRINEEMGERLVAEMKWYGHYLENGQVDRNANPTPSNKKGGLSNIAEKVMGSAAKSGASPIVEVLSPAERPSKKGLIYVTTPASNIVCGPYQLANGIGLQAFMTGRGTPYGLTIAPIVKVYSRNNTKIQWQDLIDVNADPITTGDATTQDIGTQLLHEVADVASGRKQSYAEKYRLHNDLCIFNLTPITWREIHSLINPNHWNPP